MLRVSLVTNELPPYRVPFFQALHSIPDVILQVAFCSRREPNRYWDFPAPEFGHVFLPERIIKIGRRYIHNNPGILSVLRRFSPHVIITGGFNPTHLYAFTYARLLDIPHVAMTDGSLASEQSLTAAHRAVRRYIFRHTRAFIVASEGGMKLMEAYGVPRHACFKSSLCISNQHFAPSSERSEAAFDFLFCGRLEAIKNPSFALDVAAVTSRLLGRKTSILFVGAGSEERHLREKATCLARAVDVSFHPFTSHDSLPHFYHSARLFLFPSGGDAWGVVANEACAAGTPVLTSPHAGAAGELIVEGVNGEVCELNVERWAQKAAALLVDTVKWRIYCANSLKMVEPYNYVNAARNAAAACTFAFAAKAQRTVGVDP